MRHLLSILALTSVACGPSDASRAPEASPAPRVDRPVEAAPTPRPTKATPATGPAPTATPAVRPPRLEAATVAAHRAELAAARALLTRGDLAGAVRAFDALIEHTAGSARIYCEAGYVNHRAGDDAKARRLLDAGLERFEQLDTDRAEIARALAMCLYNSGLVHEAQGEWSAAAGDYAESLEWRPSPIVHVATTRCRRPSALPRGAPRPIPTRAPSGRS